MKILKLRFKNIHSLKGEQVIDFTTAPLSVSGLFAITGPTGAGKSTILDIITLSLFNRIPRFDGKITTSEIENLGSVMTHFTDEAFAETEYQVGQKAYRSTWKISKTRNNTFRDYEMILSTLDDGKILDLKKSEVPGENEKIIGLNYDQFVRSILLSQGEFAKLLRSDKAERTSLLEEITGSKIYRTLGKAAFEKAKLKKEEINLLKQQKDAISVLNEAEIAEKHLNLENNKKSLITIDLNLSATTSLLLQAEKKIQLQQKMNEAHKSLEELKLRKAAFATEEIKLQKHKNLDIHRSEMTLWSHDSRLIVEQESEITVCRQKIAEKEEVLEYSIREMKKFTSQEINENNFLHEMKKFENKIIQLDSSLSLLKEKGTKSRSDYNKLINNNHNTHAEKLLSHQTNHEKIQYYRQVLSQFENRTKNFEKDDTIRENIAQLQHILVSLEKKHSSSLHYENAAKDISALTVERGLADIQKHILVKETEEILNKINTLKPEIEILQKKKEDQYKISGLEEHRKMLKDEEPCPLCGSTHHPYALEKEMINLGHTEALIMHLKKDLDLAQQKQISNSANLASTISRIQSLDQQINSKNTIVDNLTMENPEFKKSTSVASDLKSQSELTTSELTILQNEIESRIIVNFLENCLNLLDELSEISTQYSLVNAERQKLYGGNDVNGDADEIQNKYISARDISKELKVTLDYALERNENLTKSTEKRENSLLKSIITMGYDDVRSAISDILDDVEYQKLLKEKEILVKNDTELSTGIRAFQAEYEVIVVPEGSESSPGMLRTIINQLNTEKDTLNHTNGAITNELNKNQEALIRMAEAEILLKQKTDAAAVWYLLDKLIGDSTGSKYARYAQNLSLKHLIDLANKRLSKLSDRYLLVHTDIESDLTIIDLYQGNIKRSVKTLSGGESFIVSLALALSLADMASQNIRLESLFIDEGFGTLDAETLETAIETLEKLQSESNRTIGIISHVESLKERITTQIRVNKNTGGYATVEVVG